MSNRQRAIMALFAVVVVIQTVAIISMAGMVLASSSQVEDALAIAKKWRGVADDWKSVANKFEGNANEWKTISASFEGSANRCIAALKSR